MLLPHQTHTSTQQATFINFWSMVLWWSPFHLKVCEHDKLCSCTMSNRITLRRVTEEHWRNKTVETPIAECNFQNWSGYMSSPGQTLSLGFKFDWQQVVKWYNLKLGQSILCTRNQQTSIAGICLKINQTVLYLEVQSCFAEYSIHASTECAVQAPKIDLHPSLMYKKQHNTLEGTGWR